MKLGDRHFFKYAGAQPAREMRKEQRLESQAHVSGLVYEKPANHPERPSNMDRARLEKAASGPPDPDSPASILESMRSFRQPVPEGQEEAIARGGPDSPSAILAAIGQNAPPAQAPPGAGDLPADMRAAPAPEAPQGRIVSETA